MDEIDVSNMHVYFSATGAAASFNELPEATGYTFNSDTDGEATVKTFGGGRKVRAGDDVDNYEISALFSPTDQKALRDAKRNKTTIHIILAWDYEGLEDIEVADATMRGQKQECKILTYRYEGDAEGDYARFSFTARGEGAMSEISVLP